MYLFINSLVATMQDPTGYGLVHDGAIVIDDKNIVWVGHIDDIPQTYAKSEQINLEGRLVTPALIDCHSHIIFGGNRAHEFEMRLEGQNYEAIAKAGGGIISTVTATREATEDFLLANALIRADALIAEGVGTLEVKSGYGLDQNTELKMLTVARAIAQQRPLRVKATFLGAHAVPKETDADTYIDEVCIPTLRAAHEAGLVDAVDGFCETIAFDKAQIARVFDAARVLNLPVKLHAEQLSHMGGTKLATHYGALSADHLEFATQEDVVAMASTGLVAVLLPGAFYTLQETQKPPVSELRAARVPIAIATDWNPGSSPLGSILLAMNMACTLFGLTPAEALAGTTKYAAQALGLKDVGYIAPGFSADLAVWDLENPAELSYRIGQNPLHSRIYGGVM